MDQYRQSDADVRAERGAPPNLPPPPPPTWLPMSRSDPTTTLLSLSTCALNIDDACGFHEKQKQREYLRAWTHPAPPHCRSLRHRPAEPAADTLIHSDRLGYYAPACQKL